jgi:hypothetical protein
MLTVWCGSASTPTFTCTWACTCKFMRMYVCVWVCVCVFVCVCLYVHVCVYVYVSVYVYVFVCYVWLFMSMSFVQFILLTQQGITAEFEFQNDGFSKED